VYATALMPIVTVVAVLVGFDALALAFWCWFRAPRAPVDKTTPRPPMRWLGRALLVAGVLLIGTAAWIIALALLNTWGIGNADWSGLAMAGFQEAASQPLAFGLRCLVIASAVWVVGFGLTKGSGEKA
jgi:hypothetical protein